MPTKYAAFVLLIVALSLANAESDLHPDLLQLGAVWPVPSVSRHDISSTFGPRILASANRYDFHRGVDISAAEGTPVVAALSGTFYGVKNYASGGLTVIIDHSVNILFQNVTCTRLSTFYMHLQGFSPAIASGTKGMSITKGDVIGYAGTTGSVVSSHLHFEARLGSRCSLEYQIANPSSSCSTFGHDPHIHPLGLFPPAPQASDAVQIQVVQTVDGSTEGIVRVYSSDEYPLANRYLLRAIRSPSSSDSLHILDLSERVGFDATSTAALDTQDTTKPYIEPISFGKSKSIWEAEYRIPAGYDYKNVGESFVLELTDVHDKVVTAVVSDINAVW